MNINRIAKLMLLFSFLVIFLVTPILVNGIESSSRYLVKTDSTFWRGALGVRHTFDSGFTTNLAEWQVKFAKLFGLDLEPVGIFFILDEIEEETQDNEDLSGNLISGLLEDNTNIEVIRHAPENRIPWGVNSIYNGDTKNIGGGDGVNVAVIDTGIDSDHPDLFENITLCKDLSGTKEAVSDEKCEDANGHGTHVAGVIVANGGLDDVGIFGVAPDASLFIYKTCLVSGSCYGDDIAAAIRLAVEDGANIINISLGSDDPSSLVRDAINFANDNNVLVIASSGNDGPYLDSLDYPAAYDNVIGVGSFDNLGEISEWSSRGNNSESEEYVAEKGDINFAMPGVDVESTWLNGSYFLLSGTSIATPHLSGLAAKYWKVDSENSAVATLNILQAFSVDIDEAGDDDASGWGFSRVFIEE